MLVWLDIIATLGKGLALTGLLVALLLLWHGHNMRFWGLQSLLVSLALLTFGLILLDEMYEHLGLPLLRYSVYRRALTGVLLAGSVWLFLFPLLTGREGE